MRTTKKSFRYLKLSSIITGIIATTWFLIRVIPKPTRALYPCQRAAFPIASAFIIWLVGSITSVFIIKRAKRNFFTSPFKGSIFFAVGCVMFLLSYLLAPSISTFAANILQKEELPVLKAEQSNTAGTFKSSISIVRSLKTQSSEITADDIQTMVEEAVEMAGGLDDIINDGDTVVIKPNLVIDYSYTDNKKLAPGANGVVTDFRVIQAVVNIVRNLNPTGKIILLEGSAKGNTLTNMATVGWDKITGLDGRFAIEESSGGWYEYASTNLAGIDLPDSIALYPDNLKPNKARTIYQNKIYHNADVVISIPVLKNHCYTGITGAVKNVGIGGTPGKIYGTGQTDTNPTQRYGIDHGADYSARDNLHRWIHDFYACRPVDFVIMDGIQGSDNGPVGYGSSTLSDIQRNMRIILAGRDAIAVDAIESLIMGHDPQKVAHLVYLHNSGYGCANAALIEVLGEQVENIRVNFRITDSGMLSKFTTFTCKDYNIKSCKFSNNNLLLKMEDTLNLGRIEVSIDGQKYQSLIIGQFNNISIPTNGITITDSIVEVKFVDKYLNTLQKTYSGNVSGIRNHQLNTISLTVYPNPAKDKLNIDLPTTFTSNYNVKIFSVDGKIALNQNIKKDDANQINIQNLNPGNYIIQLFQPGIIAQTSFIKKE